MKTDTRTARWGKTVIAAEVGNEWLKLIQSDETRQGRAVSRVHVQRMDGTGAAMAEKIAEAVRTAGFTDAPVVACLPRQSVNVRLLDLPSGDPKEIADMVDLQAGKQTPYSRDEIVFDYKCIGAAREGYTRVMLVISQRSVIRQRFHALEEAGLRVEQISVSSEGLRNWQRLTQTDAEPAGRTLGILDVDATHTEFAVITDSELAFSRSLLVGATQLAGEPARWTDTLLQDVRRSLEVYRSETQGRNVDRLIVTGASSAVKSLASKLHDALGLDATELPPWSRVEWAGTPPSLQDPLYSDVSLASLIGAVLAPEELCVDLTPDAIRVRRTLEKDARNLTLLGCQVMGILALASLLVGHRFYARNEYLSELQKTRARLEKDADRFEQMKDQAKLVQQRLDLRRAPLTVLREIQKEIPPSIYLTSVQMPEVGLGDSETRIVLRGVADTGGDLQAFVRALEASPEFANVNSSSQRKDFEITCVVEK